MKFIIMGSGESGSGAVFDYLTNRPDVFDPINSEFRLVQDPGGLVDLYSSIVLGFHVNRASNAINRFKIFCEQCGRPKSKVYKGLFSYKYGLNYAKHIENYFEKVDKFISRITHVNYSGMPSCERLNLNTFDVIKYELKRKKAKRNNEKPYVGEMYLPVSEEIFLKETELFLNELFSVNESSIKNNIVVDQGGSLWAPVTTTKFYGERKAVVVTRDPRDIFSEFQFYGQAYPGADVEIFCKWYEGVMSNIDKDEWKNDIVLHIRFEEFIKNFDEEVEKLNKHLNLSDDEKYAFDPDRSVKNIGKFKKVLNTDDVKYIEKKLNRFLHF
ncbi:MAG: hypothetical protein JJU28_19540 [Cyclobacteriaceae bacterium]|nr:hypothetical protein [Cyclobacteriaceae bacterium]